VGKERVPQEEGRKEPKKKRRRKKIQSEEVLWVATSRSV